MTPLKTGYSDILRLAIPVSAGTFMQFLVVLTDNYFLSQTSDAALNGAGNAGLLYITLAMVGQGFSSTGQILIARRVGEGRGHEALNILRSGLAVMLCVSILLVALVHIALYSGFSGVFKDTETGHIFESFMSIRMWGFLPSFMSMMLVAYFMGTARSKILMWAMIVTGTVNIIGDAGLISGRWGMPALGADGAAWASLFAETFGMAVLVGNVLWRHGAELWASAWMKVEAFRRWVRLATPMVLQLTITLGTWSMFFFFVEQVGVMELKVSHIARNFFMLAFVVSQGIQQTTRTFISGLLGEGRGHALAPVIKRLLVVNASGILLVAHGGILYPTLIASPFFDAPEGLDAAVRTLPVIFTAMMMYSFSSVLLSTVQGSGNTSAALVIELTALVAYTTVSILLTLVYPQPVWLIWRVEWIYFSLMGLGCLVFLKRWDWRSKAV